MNPSEGASATSNLGLIESVEFVRARATVVVKSAHDVVPQAEKGSVICRGGDSTRPKETAPGLVSASRMSFVWEMPADGMANPSTNRNRSSLLPLTRANRVGMPSTISSS